MMDIMPPKIIQSNFLLINRAITLCEENFLNIFRCFLKGYWRRWCPSEMTSVTQRMLSVHVGMCGVCVALAV